MTETLEQFAAALVDDGVIDEAEVGQIRTRLFDDGKIDREEADFLFKVNDAVSGNANHASWQGLFVEAISSHVLEDDTSPGEIDNDEAAYLKTRIHGDGKVDETEKALLKNLKEKATGETPTDLKFLFDMYLN